MNIARLVLGTDPRPGESLPGFLIRLAGRVGIPGAVWLASLAGLRQPGCATAGSDLLPLAGLSDVRLAELESMAYGPTGRLAHHRFGEGTLHREMIDLSRRRSCPRCLSTHDHHRADWDMALLTACPAHSERLIAACPGCGRKPGWNRRDIALCRCGVDLRAAPPLVVSTAEAAAIRRLLGLGTNRETGWLPATLSACDPADLVHLAMCLGMFLTGWQRARRVETLSAAGPDSVAKVMVAGVGALVAWPTPLRDYLERARLGAGKRPGRYGARKTIGPFYGWLQGLGPGPVRDAIVAVVRELPASDPVLARRMHRSVLVSGPVRRIGPVIGMVEAAAILGCGQASMNRLMAVGALPHVPSFGRGVPMAFERAVVRTVAAGRSATIDLRQATLKLGISKVRVRRLVDAGVLPASKQGDGRWAISADSLSDLLSGIEKQVLPSVPAGEHVSFNHLSESLRRRGLSFDRVVGAVGNGSLPAASVDRAAVGLHRFRFDRQVVRAFAPRAAADALMTLQAAAAYLGLKWEVVAHLVRVGLLRGSRAGIEPADADAFGEAFVTGAALARAAGTSPRTMAHRLAAQGIKPASGPGVDGGRQNFFARTDLSHGE